MEWEFGCLVLVFHCAVTNFPVNIIVYILRLSGNETYLIDLHPPCDEDCYALHPGSLTPWQIVKVSCLSAFSFVCEADVIYESRFHQVYSLLS